jgi:hypothetical protein
MKRDLLLVLRILLSTASPLGPALLCGLTIVSIFHLIVLHPIFWFAISMCLIIAESRKASLARRWS